jgi:hypothetical protein
VTPTAEPVMMASHTMLGYPGIFLGPGEAPFDALFPPNIVLELLGLRAPRRSDLFMSVFGRDRAPYEEQNDATTDAIDVRQRRERFFHCVEAEYLERLAGVAS